MTAPGGLPPAGSTGEISEGAPTADVSDALKAAFAAGTAALRPEIVALVQSWVSTSGIATSPPDEFHWFLSKRAHLQIHIWLMTKQLAALTPCSPTGTGVVVIPRVRVDHIVDSRTNKDSVSPTGVVELLGQLFAHGSPAYAPHDNQKKYPTQLLMFDASYKATDPAAKGESPCAVIEFQGDAGFAHLRLNTAFWISPSRRSGLVATTLKRK